MNGHEILGKAVNTYPSGKEFVESLSPEERDALEYLAQGFASEGHDLTTIARMVTCGAALGVTIEQLRTN